MEGVSYPFHVNLKKYWKRRQYRRLHDGTGVPIPNKKKVKILRFGGRRRWIRIRAVPKLRLNMIANSVSPLKLWSKLKNAYVDMMLKFAGNVTSLNDGAGHDFFRGQPVSDYHYSPPRVHGVVVRAAHNYNYSQEEFESRLVFEVFKSLMASHQLPT